MPHASAALPLRKEPLLCCWRELNASHSTVTLLSVVLQYLQLKIYSYGQTHGRVQQDTAQHDRGLFQCVTAVSAPNILGINAPTSNSFLPPALHPWVSLGLLNNPSPFLSILHLLHPLLYLHCFQICYHIIHPCHLTFQFAIVNSHF